ncbi:hypothetical protein HY839_00030 [Candidatus Azambacteria bacterium]|nr:hypothetical protein [Candidatus Azambacteria bacterium]
MPPDLQIPVSVQTQLESAGDSAAAFVGSESGMLLFLLIKFVFFALTLFFIMHIIYLLHKTGNIRKELNLLGESVKRKAVPVAKDTFVVAWHGIEARMRTMQEAEYKLAIIEADKLFDDLLQKMAYKGKDMGDRLKQITTEQLSNVNAIWKCHKIRNLISHDVNYHLTYSEAQWVIQIYEDAFIELGVLDRSEQGV